MQHRSTLLRLALLGLPLFACSSASVDEESDADEGALVGDPLGAEALAALDPSSCPAEAVKPDALAKLFADGASKVNLDARWYAGTRASNGISSGAWTTDVYRFPQGGGSTENSVSVTAAMRKKGNALDEASPMYLHILTGSPKTELYPSGTMALKGEGGVLIPDCDMKAADGKGQCGSAYYWFVGHVARSERTSFPMTVDVNLTKGCLRFEHRETVNGKERVAVVLAKVRS